MWLYLAFLLIQTVLSDDPCSKHDILSSDNRMVSGNPGFSPLCDRYMKTGWYRVKPAPAGDDMPTTCVPFNTCGTNFPIWFNGTLPTVVGETNSGNACISGGVGRCCIDTKDIRVMRCMSFYVYYLTQTSGCAQRYCFGTKIKCKVGESSETGFEPGCAGDFPKEVLIPHVTPSLKNKKTLQFQCDEFMLHTRKAYYDTIWYVDGIVLENTGTSGLSWTRINNGEANLQEQMLMDRKVKIGFQVHCALKIRKTPTSTPGPWYYSHKFYAGINVDKLSIIADESSTVQIKLQLTVPFGCFGEKPCSLSIDFYTLSTKSCSGAALRHKKCGVNILADEWNQPHTYDLLIRNNMKYDENQYPIVVNFGIGQYLNDNIWSYFDLPEITVTVTDKDYEVRSKTCESKNDPHIKTFDGFFYDLHKVGEYVLYRHTEYPIEVRIKLRHCPHGYGVSYAHCHCGVKVISGNHLFTIDKCGDQHGYRPPCSREAMRVEYSNNRKKIHVYLPTGGIVVINVESAALIGSVIIKPTILDWKKSTGLCGNMNGDCTDDIKGPKGELSNNHCSRDRAYCSSQIMGYKCRLGAWAQHWRVVKNDLPKFWIQGSTYCSCDATRGIWKTQDLKPQSVCGHGVTNTCKVFRLNEDHCTRNKRDLLYDEYAGFEYDDFFVAENTNDDAAFVRNDPAPQLTNGIKWNETSANEFCESYFSKTKSHQICRNVTGVDMSQYVSQCAIDIVISGSTDYALSALEAGKSSCMIEALMDDSPPDGKENKTIFSILEDVACLRECSFVGECVNGSCICDEGFESEDCSVNKSKPPDVTAIPHDGLCDVQKRPCLATSVIGFQFVANAELTCRLNRLQVYPTAMVKTEQTYTNPAEFYAFDEVTCMLPHNFRKRSAHPLLPGQTGHGYEISVANHGRIFGSPRSIVVYDSKCQNCQKINGTHVCQFKADTCYIHSKCFANNETRDQEQCFVCDPGRDQLQWTMKDGYCYIDGACYASSSYRDQNRCQKCVPQKSTTSWTDVEECSANLALAPPAPYWVIGVVLGVLAAVCLSAALVMLVRSYLRRNKKVLPHKETDNYKQNPPKMVTE